MIAHHYNLAATNEGVPLCVWQTISPSVWGPFVWQIFNNQSLTELSTTVMHSGDGLPNVMMLLSKSRKHLYLFKY